MSLGQHGLEKELKVSLGNTVRLETKSKKTWACSSVVEPDPAVYSVLVTSLQDDTQPLDPCDLVYPPPHGYWVCLCRKEQKEVKASHFHLTKNTAGFLFACPHWLTSLSILLW